MIVWGIAACGDDLAEAELVPDGGATPDGPGAPPDGPPDRPPDGPPQHPPDPPVPPGPPELAAVCGAVPVTLADWERCFLHRSCEVQARCGGPAHFSSAEECIALSDAVSGGQQSFAAGERARALAAASGHARLDVEQFTECLLELSANRCTVGWNAPACELRFRGDLEDQQSCYSDIECRSPGAHCAPGDCGESCCPGMCQPRKKLHETCAALLDCEPGLMCGRDGRCVSGDLGSRCGSSADCDWDAWCDRRTQECKPSAGEGTLCQTFLQCGGETACVGLLRPVQPPRCQRVSQAGDPCDGDCFGNFYCELPATGLGVCAPLPIHGQECSLFLPCAGANEVCDQGTCAERRDVGQLCADVSCRRGLFCGPRTESGPVVCQEPLADGKFGCRHPEECASYICSGSATQAGVCQPYRATCP